MNGPTYTDLGQPQKPSLSDSTENTLVPISNKPSTWSIEPKQWIVCGSCDRRFWPDFKGQKFCDHECYSNSLRSVDSVARFWAKVNKNGPIARPGLTPCWLWTANRSGARRMHGQFTLPRLPDGKQRHVQAHRFSWELVNGPIPDGLFACHICDVGICVNPEHLFLGTPYDNNHDAIAKGRIDHTVSRDRTLTYEQRLSIFHAPRTPGSGIALAAQYKVSEACISKIRQGRFARQQPVLERVPFVYLDIRGEVA